MSALLFWDNANNYRATALARVAHNKKAVGGKVVVVTGANGVQGRELTKAFYANGAHVIMAGRTLSKLEKVKADVVAKDDSAEPGTIECMVLDLSDYDSIDAFVKQLDGRRRPVHASSIPAGCDSSAQRLCCALLISQMLFPPGQDLVSTPLYSTPSLLTVSQLQLYSPPAPTCIPPHSFSLAIYM